MDGVTQEIFLHAVIQRGISHEAGRLIDLDEPWFALLIKEYVDTKDLKAEWVLYILRLWRFVYVGNVVYSNHQSLDTYLLDIFPNFIAGFIFCALSMLVDIIENRCKTTFVSYVILSFILVLNEAISVFIDSIIGQMHA